MLEQMRFLRRKKGLTMKQLGEIIGVTEVTVSTYETGKREPSLDTLCAIADALDVSLDMLIRGKEKDRPEGRPINEMLQMYGKLSDRELELILAVINASLADRRYKASLRQAGQE